MSKKYDLTKDLYCPEGIVVSEINCLENNDNSVFKLEAKWYDKKITTQNKNIKTNSL